MIEEICSDKNLGFEWFGTEYGAYNYFKILVIYISTVNIRHILNVSIFKE